MSPLSVLNRPAFFLHPSRLKITPVREGFDLVQIQPGVLSLRSRECGEIFHPVIGPRAEAFDLHAAPQRFPERGARLGRPLEIWDVGLGAATNTLAIIELLRKAKLTA